MTGIQDSRRPSVTLRLPFERDSVLRISPTYALLRERAPVVRVTTPANDPALAGRRPRGGEDRVRRQAVRLLRA